jgi:hypothetical protein
MKYLAAITAITISLAITAVTIQAMANSGAFDPPPMTAAELQIKQSQEWNAHVRGEILRWGITIAVALAALAGAGWLIAKARNERERVYADERGLWPVVRHDKATLWQRLRGEHDWIESDANLAIAPARRIHANGSLNVEAHTYGADMATQAAHSLRSWGVQNTVANASSGRGMTVAAARLSAGEFDARTRWHEARAQLAKDKLRAPVAALPEPAAPRLDLPGAMQDSTAERWILGQAANGALAEFNPRTAVHAGIIGASGTGKTESTGELMLLYALNFGYHPIILDPKGGVDWSPWAGHAEYHETTPGNFTGQLQAIERMHDARHTQIMDAGLATVDRLPQPPAPIWLMIEEYGDIRRSMKNATEVDRILNRLLTQARMTRIHVLLIDQYPEHWDGQVMANTKAKFVFHLGGYAGNVVKAYHADQLALCGEFEYGGQRYTAWHTAAMRDRFLRVVPSSRSPRVIDGEWRANDRSPEVRTTVNDMNGGGSGYAIPPSLTRSFARTGRWDEFAEGFFRINPDASQSDLRSAMSEIDGREPNAFKGVAHDTYHRFSPHRGQEATEPTPLEQLRQQYGNDLYVAGQRIGMDKSVEI